MIVTGEASGDLHGGALAEALLLKKPELDIVGFGGENMRAAGVDIRFDINQLGIVGLIEVAYHFKVLIQAYRSALKLLQEGVNLLVLIDFPDFNLRLAKEAKGMGILVVYYVSPQIWAWRSGRMKTISERIDQMLVILPFEKQLYENANVPCEFVGHPLLDELVQLKTKKISIAHEQRTPDRIPKKGKGPVIALLPGSRKREVIVLLPIMLEAIGTLLEVFPLLQVLIPVAPSLPESMVYDLISSCSFPVKLIKGEVYDAFHASDIAVVASGTATLQGALAGTPMVVVYKVSWISYFLAKFLVNLESVSLVNIVADQPFIPELIQREATSSRISKEVRKLIEDKAARELMKRRLKSVADRLGTAGASVRAAAVICRLLDQRTLSPKNGAMTQKVPT